MPASDISFHPERTPQVVSQEGIAVREDTAHTDAKGKDKAKLRKETHAALAKLREPLAKLLEPGEVVLYVTRGQAPVSFLDQFMMGWYIRNATAACLVLTNLRLLIFRINLKALGGWDWSRSVRSLRWGDVAESKVPWSLLSQSVALHFHDGTKETYWGFGRGPAKKIKLLLETLLPASTGEASPARAPVQHCPGCEGVLPAASVSCPQCGQAFKDQKTMIRWSLLLPGGGYFYTGRTGLGVLDAIVESILIGVLVAFMLHAGGLPEAALGPLEPSLNPVEALFAAGLIAFVLAAEKLVTIHHGRRFLRDLIPADGSASRVGWVVIGVLSYALAAFIAFASIDFEEPLATPAPDLTIASAQFGLFQMQRDGTYEFVAADRFAADPNREYGWILRIRTSRERLSIREEQHLLMDEPEVYFNEGQAGTESGLVYSTWQMDEDEPVGTRKLVVSLDGVPVHTFTFRVLPPAGKSR